MVTASKARTAIARIDRELARLAPRRSRAKAEGHETETQVLDHHIDRLLDRRNHHAHTAP